jgi:hypothetical protein
MSASRNRQWTITVDFVPGQGYEAAVESDGSYHPGGYEADDIHALLASVADELTEETA